MTDPFADERIQFFLRNRADIKAWAAIESEVIAATRELLSRAQPQLEDALLSQDPTVLLGRNDGGQWERIMARREHWPGSVGLTLEWQHRNVDPSTNAPKIGVFWWADPPTLVDPRSNFVAAVDKRALQKLGYKVPMSGVWPVGTFAGASPHWWHDPASWIAELVERLAATWPFVAPHIDRVLPENWRVSGG